METPKQTPPTRKRKLSKEEIAELIERGNPDVFRWEDDDLALKSAAAHSRLPHDKMTSQEMAAFSEIAASHVSTAIYLHIRNKILQLFLLEPNVECTKEHAIDQIMTPFNSDRQLVRRVHSYLERYGYINFGSFHQISARPPHTKKKVIVIGAGVSGMIAARQLKHFGFDVVVLEGRPRVGGRVHTHHCVDFPKMRVDLGAMVLTGVCGNPLVTVAKQMHCTLQRLNGNTCLIYDSRGKVIDRRKDNLVEEAFDKIGDIASYIVHEKQCDTLNGEPLDLETAYDNIMCLLELRCQKKRLLFHECHERIAIKMKGILEEMNLFKKTAEEIGNKIKALEQTPLAEFNSKQEKEILRRCYKRDLINAIKKYDEAEFRKKNVDSFVTNLKRLEPNEVFMNLYDRRVLDFHFANLEYANGTALRNISLKHWDQDDDNEIAGSHLSVKEGMGHIVCQLLSGTDIILNRKVTKIEYSQNGVRVECLKTAGVDRREGEEREEGGTMEEYTADIVLCTLPLGVLKKSVKREKGFPVFSPPLPPRMVTAVDRVGFGNLNKVVLVFPRVFWDRNTHFFGTAATPEKGIAGSTKTSRGELYMFVAQTDKPILTGIMAGEAADTKLGMQGPNALTRARDLCVNRAMEVLHSIFGNHCPPSPIEAVVTMWHEDPFTLGCYSYMAKYSEAADYDVLAEPLKGRDGEGEGEGEESEKERLFFAGEHTNRNYPATVHGAFLSGLREAGRIADLYAGVPYAAAEGADEVITLEVEEYVSEREQDKLMREAKRAKLREADQGQHEVIDLASSPDTSRSEKREDGGEMDEEEKPDMSNDMSDETDGNLADVSDERGDEAIELPDLPSMSDDGVITL